MPALSIDLTVARRLELAHAQRSVHYAEAYHALHPQDALRIEAVAGGYAIYCQCVAAGALAMGLHGPVSEAEFAQAEEVLRAAEAPADISLCPLADPSLSALLHRAGYGVRAFRSFLALPLTGYQPVGRVPGVEVTPAAPEQAELWIAMVAEGFADAPEPGREMLELLAPNFSAAHGQPFFAWIDGEPAGGGAIYVHGAVAELGSDSTRPAYRRRGVHRALVQARLVAAREMGCDLALAVTEPGSDSQRNVERLGFRLAYTEVVASPRPRD
jgi:GNAT superfamily N-acetyltransferase